MPRPILTTSRNDDNPYVNGNRPQQNKNGWNNIGARGTKPVAKIIRCEDDIFLPKTKHQVNNQEENDANVHVKENQRAPHPRSLDIQQAPNNNGWDDDMGLHEQNQVQKDSNGENENDRPFTTEYDDNSSRNNNQWGNDKHRNSDAYRTTVFQPPTNFSDDEDEEERSPRAEQRQRQLCAPTCSTQLL